MASRELGAMLTARHGRSVGDFHVDDVRLGPGAVVDPAELRIAADEYVALTGTNGSSRTTLLRAGLG